MKHGSIFKYGLTVLTVTAGLLGGVWLSADMAWAQENELLLVQTVSTDEASADLSYAEIEGRVVYAPMKPENIAAQEKVWEIINTYVDPAYHLTDPERENLTDAQFKELRQVALTVTADCTTQYEKIKAITEFVSERIYYDHRYYQGYSDSTFINPYEVYTEKRTVCEGYANLMRTLLNAIDIPCMILIGEDHGYNAVYDSEQDEWIFADATWCSLNAYTIDGQWVYGGHNLERFDLQPAEIAGLSSHEVVSIEGIKVASDDSLYYTMRVNGITHSLADFTLWNQMDWYIEVSKVNAAKIKVVDSIAGIDVKVLRLYRSQLLQEIDLSATKLEKIGEYSLAECSNLKTVILPDTVKVIEQLAFDYCTSLPAIDLSNTQITNIEEYAFRGCEALISIQFPSTLTHIGTHALYECPEITTIDLSGTRLTTVEESVFEGMEKLTTVKLPATLTQLGWRAFGSCTSLQKIDLGNTKITGIGDQAFYNCSSLKSIILPDTLTTMGSSVFYGCTALQEMDLSNTKISDMGEHVFYDCNSLTSIKLSAALTELDAEALYGCNTLETVDLSETRITTVADSLFAGRDKLCTVKLPSTVTAIGEGAFWGCTSLQKIDLAATKTAVIGDGAFNNCSALTNVTFPATLSEMGEEAFRGCSALTTVDLSKTKVTSLATMLFWQATNLREVKLPTTVTSIGDSAFNDTALKEINLEDKKTTHIGEYAFYYCEALTSIKFPSTLTELGAGALSGCSEITTVDLSATKITTVGDYTFNGLGKLREVKLPATVTLIGDSAFYRCSSLQEINLSHTKVTGIGEEAFFDCSNVEVIRLPETLTEIGAYAFAYGPFSTKVITTLSAEALHYPGEAGEWFARNIVICATEDADPTPTPVPSQKPSEDANTQVADFVSRMYTVVLNRTADPVGMNDWTGWLLDHTVDGAAIAQGFILSDEFLAKNVNNEEYMNILYRTFFNREADAEGRATWMALLESGTSRISVLAGFVNSNEFDVLCTSYGIIRGTMEVGDDNTPTDGTGINGFVERLYSKVLGRASDAAGIATWVGVISDGTMSAEEVSKSFFFSEEYLTKNTDDATFVNTLYETFMNRAADAEGGAFWLNYLAGGASRTEVLEGFSRSVEFAEILKSYGL